MLIDRRAARALSLAIPRRSKRRRTAINCRIDARFIPAIAVLIEGARRAATAWSPDSLAEGANKVFARSYRRRRFYRRDHGRAGLRCRRHDVAGQTPFAHRAYYNAKWAPTLQTNTRGDISEPLTDFRVRASGSGRPGTAGACPSIDGIIVAIGFRRLFHGDQDAAWVLREDRSSRWQN